MIYHALFVIGDKAAKFEIVICCKIGGALWVNNEIEIDWRSGVQIV